MASLEDYYDNGILKSVLAKNVNNFPVPVYPKSSSDIITYEDTTVKEKLKSLDNVILNLQSLVNSISKDITTIYNSRYDKNYINAQIEILNGKIRDIQSSIATIEGITNNFSFYTKNEADTLLSALSSTIEQNFNLLSARMTTLNDYVLTEYYNSSTVNDRFIDISNQIDGIRETVTVLFNQQLEEFKNQINHNVAEAINNYYNKTDIDEKMSEMTHNITELNNTLADIRSEADEMNAQAVIDINNYVNEKNDAVMAHVDRKINEHLASVERTVQAQTEAINVLVESLHGEIVNISSNVAAQIAAIDDSSTDKYQNGDEEEF